MKDNKAICWDLEVKTVSRFRVSYTEPVTFEEAVRLFNSHDYYDVIDSEEYEAVATGEPG